MEQNKSYILSINCGSSSIKFAIYTDEGLKRKIHGHVVDIGSPNAAFQFVDEHDKRHHVEMLSCNNNQSAIDELSNWLRAHYQEYPITAIGHRIVQGGPDHMEPEIIDDQLIRDLQQLTFLAPNHLPAELAAISLLKSSFPQALQVACYDTYFHRELPDYVRHYPLPEKYQRKELIKYGFHGLSCEYIARQLKKDYGHINHQKIIIAHLGNGASLTAVKHGRSVDTTMGLTPIGGLLMGTRSGDIDPGVPIFILKQWGLTADELDELFSKESGLRAIAGTADMQELLQREPTDAKAAEAVTAFVYSVKKQIGALTAVMDGLDVLVFTGGIGENAVVIRERICEGLDFLGIRIHQKYNKHHHGEISSKSSKVKVLVIPTDEEGMLAQHTQDIINIKILTI